MENNVQHIASYHNNVHRECSNVEEHIERSKPVYEIYLPMEI